MMDKILDKIINIISTAEYGSIITIFLIIIIIYAIFNKIKFKCLEKISNFIAEVEKNTELSGEQKFELVKTYLNNEIFISNNILFQKIINKLIQTTYDNSKNYAINYIARKANINIDEVHNVLNTIKEETKNKSEE